MAATSPVVARRPHFRRHNPPAILITDDDVAMIRHVAEHRFRRSTDLVRLMRHRAEKKIIERLGVLYQTSYLDRPRAQRDYFTAKKRAAYIYGLGNNGAALLAELDGVEASKVDWTDKNRDAGRPFLHHALLVGDVITAAQRAAHNHPHVRFIAAADILKLAPEATQRADNPWKIRAKVPTADTLLDLALVPDAVFGFDFTQARKRVYFKVEADRSTMPVVRSNFQQTSLLRKFATYLAFHQARQHTARYGIGNFRVMTVTTSPQRVASMVSAVKSITGGKGSNLFLFSDAPSLAAAPDALSLAWITGTGARIRLAD